MACIVSDANVILTGCKVRPVVCPLNFSRREGSACTPREGPRWLLYSGQGFAPPPLNLNGVPNVAAGTILCRGTS